MNLPSAFTPTTEQAAIVEFARSSTENLLISALAGAAKTTTLELICHKISSIPILSLAFNKKIAEEMAKRLPSHVSCSTMNGLGHRTWQTYVGRRLTLDTKKSYNILSTEIEALPKRRQRDAFNDFPDILKAVNSAKHAGYLPALFESETVRGCVSRADFAESFEDDLFAEWGALIDRSLEVNITSSLSGVIDFNDQIYMPTLFGGIFPKFPLVLVDEAQDLSALNHAMLRKLVTKRLIAVGDPFQSIYGFRGAVSDGMAALGRDFSMREMPLNITFRCPRAIVERARSRAPAMLYPEWAEAGEVRDLTTGEASWAPAEIPDGAAIICRNNAPLFKLALHLIRCRRGVKLVGSDIGPALVKILKKFGDGSLRQETVLKLITEWTNEQLAKRGKGHASVYDRADCLRVFAEAAPTLAGAIAYAEDLFKREGPIQLLSGHKSKGLEWDTVFHLDPWRIPSEWAEDLEQELNVRYVIETRAKKTLVLANLGDFKGEPG